MSALDTVKRRIAGWLARIIIVFVGMMPVSCHYELTGPALWSHHSSYAFEAWLVMWIVSIALAVGAIYFAITAD